MFEQIDLQQISIILGIIISGYVLGKIIQVLVRFRLKNNTNSKFNEVENKIAESLGNYPPLIFTFAGAYISSFFVNLENAYLPQIRTAILVLIIILITGFIAKISSIVLKLAISKNSALITSTSIFTNVAKISIYVVGILVALQSAGINITALVATLGVGGIAIALALQDTLSNLFAGIYLIAARKIRPGDYIELDSGDKGYVEDISWRNTQIRELGDDDMIIVPNADLASTRVKNYYLPERELSVLIDCGVSYDSDLEKVEKVVIEVATEIQKNTEGAVKEFSPFIRYNEFANSSINFTVILRGNQFVDQFLVKHEFIKILHKRFKEENIEIPFPQNVVTLKK